MLQKICWAVIPTPLLPGKHVSFLETQSFLSSLKLHFSGSTESPFLASVRWRRLSVSSSFTDSFTCFCSVCSALCAHSDRIALFWIFPPDCPNKPEQTGRRQRGDVTHSSEPWRLSAWRRSGGLHGDVKQESSHSELLHSPAWREEPWEQTGSGALSFIYHLKQRDEITAQRTCRAASQPVNSIMLLAY